MATTSQVLQRLRQALLSESGLVLSGTAMDEAYDLGFLAEDVLEVLGDLESADLERRYLGQKGVWLYAFVYEDVELELYVKLADHQPTLVLVSFHETRL